MATRLRVYIASAITLGDLCDNINVSTDCFHRLLKAGFAPLSPVWSCFSGGCHKETSESIFSYVETVTRVLAEAESCPRGTTWKDWIDCCLPWVEVADAVLRLPGVSKGADAECSYAMQKDVPVFYTETALLEWKKSIDKSFEDAAVAREREKDIPLRPYNPHGVNA